MRAKAGISLAIVAAGFAALTAAAVQEKQVQVLAPGWGELNYDPPAAGSYQLRPIYPAPGGEIVLSNGAQVRLDDYLRGKVTVLSFIYTRCTDVNGCPLATFVLHSMQKALHGQPGMKDKVRFISLSFDPENDTPQALQAYARDFSQKEGYEWLFATTESRAKLKTILDGYGQYTFEVKGEDGKSAFAHILRAFLIDSRGQVRNIYSVDFLHPKILLADIETILLENE